MSIWPLLIVAAHGLTAFGLMTMSPQRRRSVLVIGTAPLVLAAVAASVAAGAVIAGTTYVAEVPWLPSIGVAFDVRFDPLALIFTLAVAAVGVAIVMYSAAYLSPAADLRRFVALLVGFAGAMIGVAISDNLFGLFVFWELTTITSYLLIGFEDEKGSARAAALQALLATSFGGLAMLGGFVILAQAAGTPNLSEIVASPPQGADASVAILLIVLGAFTKSAQAPFHFWLPGAMAAPTPASAYLHSATMVKAGVLLLLRLAPGFATVPLWTPLVLSAGLATMTIGAWRALRETDLKLVLAYGTVSQLGLMTALIGLGTPAMLHAALAVLIAHVLFKSTLFLVVGAIDHQTGTRDLRVLSGLGRRLPGLAVVAGLAAASMAGIAPLLGFVTKEAAIAALVDQGEWTALVVIAAASALTAAYSLRFMWGAFADKPPSAEVDLVGSDVPAPRGALWASPAVLAVSGLVFGVFPGWADALVAAAASGGKLVLWPGWKPALGISIGIVLAGTGVFAAPVAVAHAQRRVASASSALRVPSAEGAYRRLVDLLNRTADRATGVAQNGSLPVYLGVILVATVSVPAVAWIVAGGGFPSAPRVGTAAELALGAFVVAASIAVLRTVRRLAAVILLGAIGYSVAGIFILSGAPDLALTLILVETVIVAVFVFVLNRLPRRFEQRRWGVAGALRIGVSLAVGGFVTAAALVTTGMRSSSPVSREYTELAPAAGGRNVVNVILTDFRALDTLGEIAVIGVAAVGIGALVVRHANHRRRDHARHGSAREAA